MPEAPIIEPQGGGRIGNPSREAAIIVSKWNPSREAAMQL